MTIAPKGIMKPRRSQTLIRFFPLNSKIERAYAHISETRMETEVMTSETRTVLKYQRKIGLF
jgi:hypothetical protein